MPSHASYLPRVSLFDPAEASEGSIDPLGLAQLATTLAEGLVPEFTERSVRPRFLSALVFGAHLLGRPNYPDGVYGDFPQGPANIAFERLLNESFARCGEAGDRGLIGVPGIGKARDAAKHDARLTSQLYLVAPGAVGLWVAYKRLARGLQLIDDTGRLLENGYELLHAWETGERQRGRVTGAAASDFLSDLDRALEPLLDGTRETRRPKSSWSFLYEHLRPHGMTASEAKVLRRLIVSGDERRSDVFGTIEARSEQLDVSRKDLEDPTLRLLRAHGNAATRAQVNAILAYERVVELLLAAFDAVRFVGGARPDGRVDAEAVLARSDVQGHLRKAPAALRSAIEHATPKIDGLGHIGERQSTLSWLDASALSSPHAFFDALLERHFATQRSKPPDGKRPWIEGDASGYFVRTRYIPDEPPRPRATFHPYRTIPVRSMLHDIRKAEK